MQMKCRRKRSLPKKSQTKKTQKPYETKLNHNNDNTPKTQTKPEHE